MQNQYVSDEDQKTVYYTESMPQPEYADVEKGHNLIIIDSSNQVKEFDLSDFHKTRITIGRDASNDIHINSQLVSSFHGKFKFVGNQLMYADLGSTNGTIIEGLGSGRLLKGNQNYYPMRDGEIFKIKLPVGKEQESVLILYNHVKEAGVWRQFHLETNVIKIGRSPENEIVLSNPSVSRVHAIMEKSGSGYTIRDNNSLNGVLVNGESLGGSYALQEKDVIQIFNSQLIYTHDCVYYKNSCEGISLEIVNMNKFVGREKKQILTNVNLEIGSNEFVAIIGGSGAGKSTLMNAISGFDSQGVVGDVFCNGIDLHKNFNSLKNMIGYVPQQDIIYENLTLRKMLYFTAKMKMPSDTTKDEISQRIDKVLSMVELSEHQNTYIRKLSGGQKKRASIAVELLADPSLFFLDEPTSGLDPGTEKNLMQTLSKLSKSQGKTIIMVTHTTQNLHLCDKVIFMGPGGRLCFCGTTEQAKMFFDTDDLVNIYNMMYEDPKTWAEQFASCMADAPKQAQSEKKLDTSKKRTNGFRQMAILTARYAQLVWNDKPKLLMLLLQPVAIAFLLSVVSSKEVFDTYEDTKSILFALSCAGIWTGIFNSIQEVCKERVILKREYMANMKLSSYIMSKYNVQLLVGLVQAIALTGLFMILVGKPEKGIFMDAAAIEMIVIMWATIMASMSMGLIISAAVKTGDQAMTAAPFLLIIQLLFSGILFVLEGLSSKIAYITISKWSVEAFGSVTDLNNYMSVMEKDFPQYTREVEDMFECSKEHFLLCLGVMVLFMVVCGVSSTIVLRSVAKDSR